VTRYGDWRAARFFPGLEGLRAVAALLVVLHHTRTHRLWGVVEGWNGVTLFFVLSGFLITTIALREEDERGFRWRAFVVRRGFRILPVYVVGLALYAAAMAVLGIGAAHRTSFVHAVPWYLSPFPEVPFFSRVHIVFSLAWSLGIEEKFYVLWPLLAFVLLRRSRVRLPLAAVLAVASQIPVALTTGGRAVAPYGAILVGCVLAFLLHDRRAFGAVARLGTRGGLALAVAAVAGAELATHRWNPTAAGFRVASPFYYLPYAVAAAVLVGSLALRPSRLFAARPLRFVGRVSYPLYLTHPLALAIAGSVVKPGGVAVELVYLALALVLALCLAYALHRTVERPLIAVGKRLAARPSRRAAAPALATT
jgi:peptidoglycan/LPS O-acetylase OafA/YrhL